MNKVSQPNNAEQLRQLSGFLTYRVSRLHGKLNAQATRILRNTVGITLNQWRMIAFIGSAGRLSASQLIQYSALDKGLVSRNVKALIEIGHVKSTPHESDSRVHLLTLSESGLTIFERALPLMRKRQIDLQKDISAEDVRTFIRVAAAIEQATDQPHT